MAQISPVSHRTPTMLTSSHSSRAITMSPREQLLKLLDQGSDVILVFTGADGTVEEVPAHSLILQQWSEVLAGAISTDRSSSSSSSKAKSRIPMDGTSKEDWVLAMEYIYPVQSPNEVTWDNVEALLQVGDKYGMPALWDRVSSFFSHHKNELELQPGKLSVWRWIVMLDRYGHTAAAKECIDSQSEVPSLVDACPEDCLPSLSGGTMQHLFNVMKLWLPRCLGNAYCNVCHQVTDWKPLSDSRIQCTSCYKCSG